MAICAVIGLPFKIFSVIFGLLAAFFGISNIIPLIAVVGTFIIMIVTTLQQAFTGDTFVSTLIMGLIAAGLVAGVLALFMNVWIIAAGILMKMCALMETAFGNVDYKMYQGYSFCKRHYIVN